MLKLSYCVAVVSALDVKFTETAGGNAAYTVSHGGKMLFSGDDGVAAFVEGKWQTPSNGMKRTGTKTVKGSEVGLGDYTGTEITWQAGKNTVIVTTAKTYSSGMDVGFEYSFPKGAEATSQVIFTPKCLPIFRLRACLSSAG